MWAEGMQLLGEEAYGWGTGVLSASWLSLRVHSHLEGSPVLPPPGEREMPRTLSVFSDHRDIAAPEDVRTTESCQPGRPAQPPCSFASEDFSPPPEEEK